METENEESINSAFSEPLLTEIVVSEALSEEGYIEKPIEVQKPTHSPTRFRLMIGLILVVAFLACVGAVTAAVYLLPFSDKFVRSVTSVAPYPVAVINMQPISFRNFYKEYDALQSFYTSKDTPAEERLSDSEISDNILDTIIERRIIDQLAKQYQIEVDETKVTETLQTAYTQGGSEEEFNSEIKTVFGWDNETFLDHVIRPMILASQVEEAVQSDTILQSESRTKIDSALADLKNGELFATVAAANSEDPSATNGGDLGYLTTDQMPPEWLAFFVSTDLNVPSEVIDLGTVYTVAMATDKVEGEDGTIKYTVKAIIVYKKGLAAVIESFKESSKIWKFLKAG